MVEEERTSLRLFVDRVISTTETVKILFCARTRSQTCPCSIVLEPYPDPYRLSSRKLKGSTGEGNTP